MAAVEPFQEKYELGPERTALVHRHLSEVCASQPFVMSKRAQDFLHLVVEHALNGRFDYLRERVIGAEMFGRPADYDTGNDPVVRVKAGEVRKKLALFYAQTGGKHAVRIELPNGHYVPKFHFAPSETAALPESRAAPSTAAEPNTAPGDEPPVERPAGRAVEAARLPWGKSWRSPRILGGVALGLLFMTIGGYAVVKRWHNDSEPRREIRSIAILPLKNLSSDPGQEYFADGMTEELINALGRISKVRVISMTSAMSYKGTKKKLPEIARDLNMDAAVEGTVQRDGNQVRISVQLIDATTDRPIWANSYVRDLTNVLSLQGEVAQAIANEVSMKGSSSRQTSVARPGPVNVEVEDLYLQGMSRLNMGEFNGAIDYLQRAIAADTNFAQAHAALAACYGTMGESGYLPYGEAFARQKTEAAITIALDGSLPTGHVELANAAMDLDGDWTTAASEFHRALELNPNSSYVHQQYAVYLERIGKLPEAIAEMETAVNLDPVSPSLWRKVEFTYYFSRQYDQALALMRKTQALNIDLSDNTFLLGDVYAEKGMLAKSIEEFRKLSDTPHALGHLGNALARAGQTDAAHRTVARLQEHVRRSGVGRYEIALVYAGLGNRKEALAWLEEAHKAHDEGLTNLNIDPCLDPLRSDLRFKDLVRRAGPTL